MKEYWDLLDENKQLVHKTHQRGKPIPIGYYHSVVQIWTMNLDHELLLTQRDWEKPWGGYWEITAGSVLAGESVVEGALRELEEETGIKASKEELKYLGYLQESDTFYESFLLVKDLNIKNIRLQEHETCNARFVSYETCEQMMKNKHVAEPIIRRYESLKEQLPWEEEWKTSL